MNHPNVGDGFCNFGQQHPLSFHIVVGPNSQKMMRVCYRESGSKVESPNEPKCVSTVIHGRLGLILNEQGNNYFV